MLNGLFKVIEGHLSSRTVQILLDGISIAALLANDRVGRMRWLVG